MDLPTNPAKLVAALSLSLYLASVAGKLAGLADLRDLSRDLVASFAERAIGSGAKIEAYPKRASRLGYSEGCCENFAPVVWPRPLRETTNKPDR